MKTYAGLDAGDPVTHGVDASFRGVRLDHNFKLRLAALQLLLPVDALRLAEVQHQRLWVHAARQHAFLRVHGHVHPIIIVIGGWEVESLFHNC